LFLASVWAEDMDDEEGGGWDAVKGWFKDDQEPVEYMAYDDGWHYLDGKYGWYVRAGVDQVFIAQTVMSDQDFGGWTDGQYVLTFAQIEDPDNAGQYEAFYCSVVWNMDSDTGSNVDVETFEGPNVDLYSFTGGPDTWCPDEPSAPDYVEGCMRQSLAQWQEFATWSPYTSTYDAATTESSQACSAYRLTETGDNYIAIKSGQPYTVSTGWTTYLDANAYDTGNYLEYGKGDDIVMTFEDPGAATALAAGVAAFAAALAF
jgi:hypothetical protein